MEALAHRPGRARARCASRTRHRSTLTLPAGDSARVALLRPSSPSPSRCSARSSPAPPPTEAGLAARRPHRLGRRPAPMRTWSEFVEVIQRPPGRADAAWWWSAAAPACRSPSPRSSEREMNAEMERVEVGRIGVAPAAGRRSYRPLGAGRRRCSAAPGRPGSTSAAIVQPPRRPASPARASPRSLGGPLAIGQLSGQAARFGLEAFLQFMALLSVNLAVLNLLPIPVLDGGQLLFLLVEARARPARSPWSSACASPTWA